MHILVRAYTYGHTIKKKFQLPSGGERTSGTSIKLKGFPLLSAEVWVPGPIAGGTGWTNRSYLLTAIGGSEHRSKLLLLQDSKTFNPVLVSQHGSL